MNSIMRDYFQIADKSKDGKLDSKELKKLLESLNIHVKKDDIKKLMITFDANNDGSIDDEEFAVFISNISKRKEIISLFRM
jgi:Ca2+-binding EF-hand superfamily protein